MHMNQTQVIYQSFSERAKLGRSTRETSTLVVKCQQYGGGGGEGRRGDDCASIASNWQQDTVKNIWIIT